MNPILRAAQGAAVLMCIALSSTAYAGYKRINQPNPSDAMDVHIYRLDNGLTVYLTENHETPRFYAEIMVRAGSKHDPSETTGLAHYLEHLLFKGNRKMGTVDYRVEKTHLDRITELYEEHFNEEDGEKRKAIYGEINRVSREASQYAIANEIDKLYSSMGGTHVNAHTWVEETVYKVSMPSNRLRQWATVESSRFVDPVFRLFHTELETVYEEKNRALDNKERVLSEAVNKVLYKTHPYGQQPTLGSVEHLKRPSLMKIYGYYRAHYVPNNMAITISGDIGIAEAIAIIDAEFSNWRSQPLDPRNAPREEPLDGAERVNVNYRGEEKVLLAFRTASISHEDADTLELIDMILDNSAAGLINLNLNQQQKVRMAGSYPYIMNDYGAQYLFGIPKEGQTLEEVEGLLLDQLELIRSGQLEDWIIPAIITDFKITAKSSLESDQARVAIMRDSFIAYELWDNTVDKIRRMEKITKEDVIRVANRYFGGDYVAGYRHDEQQVVPNIEKPQIDPVDIDPKRQSRFAKDVLDMPHSPMEPVFVDPAKDYEVTNIAKGVKLYYTPNPLNDLFSFSMSVEFGTHEDNKIGAAAQLLDKSGAGAFDAKGLKKEWYKLGSSFSFSAGDNETVVSVSGLDENFEASIALMMEALERPSASDETLEELKSIILARREDAKKDQSTLARALSLYNRYGEDSFFLRLLPESELKKLTVEELHASIKNILSYERTLTYTGSLPLGKVMKTIKKHMASGGHLKDPPPYRFLKARVPGDTEIFFFHKEAAQAQVRIEFPDGVFDDSTNTGVQLYNSYFAGGMSGIVFQELREARALAYFAAARYVTGGRKGDENLMIGVISCQADKTPEAVDAFLDLFDNLPRSPERFAQAKDALVNQYKTAKLGFRRIIGAVRSWERLGLEVDPRRARYTALKASSMDDMLSFHGERIKDRPKLISIVGDKNKIDMEALAKHGTITEVNLEEIFVD